MSCFTRAVLLSVVVCVGGTSTQAAVTDGTARLLHASLLDGLQLDSATGAFWIGDLQAALPVPAGGGGYSPDGGGKLWAILSTQDGTQVARHDFYGEKGAGQMWAIGSAKVTALAGEAVPDGRVKLAAGSYVLEFHLDSGQWYKFPFTVSVQSGNGRDYYFIDGDWNNWAYLLYAGGDPEEALVWKVWLRNKAPQDTKTVRARVEIARDADGKVICTSRPDTSQDLTPTWNRFAFDLIHPMEGTSGGAYFKAAALLGQDGAYTLKMSLDNTPYGTWKFAVAGGKLSCVGRTDRTQADPLTFIEGGDAWWYEGETSAGDVAAVTEPTKPEPTLTFIPDAKPVMVNGVAMLEAESLLNWLGATVKAEGGKVTAAIGEHRLEMTVGSTNAVVDGKTVAALGGAVERDGDTWVPIRFACEALGGRLAWDAGTKTLTIIEPQGLRMTKVKMP